MSILSSQPTDLWENLEDKEVLLDYGFTHRFTHHDGCAHWDLRINYTCEEMKECSFWGLVLGQDNTYPYYINMMHLPYANRGNKYLARIDLMLCEKENKYLPIGHIFRFRDVFSFLSWVSSIMQKFSLHSRQGF